MPHPQLQTAIALHRSGRLAEAEQLYREVLRHEPNEAQALHLLGLIADQTGRRGEAEGLVERAISLRPSADFFNSLGLIREGMGNSTGAESCYRRALSFDPGFVKALNNLGGVLQARGDFVAAERTYRQATTLAPRAPSALNNLGTVLQAQGKFDEAITTYRQALALRPSYVEALANLGSAQAGLGRFDDAATCLEQALALKPDYGRAQLQLGAARIAQARPTEAVGLLRRAVELLPQSAEAHYQLGRALAAASRLDEAQIAFEVALRTKPDYLAALDALAAVLVEKIELAPAAERYRQALVLKPDLALRIKRATMMPAICASEDEIDARRAAMEEALDGLLEEPLRLDHPLAAATSGGFFLAYHGRDDRALQQKLAAVYAKACPALQFVAPHCERPARGARLRVGFISRFMYRHSIGRTTRGLVAALSREEFEVIALFAPPLVDDETSRFIRDRADSWRVLSSELGAARQEIAALELDVLFYQDIGMDPYTYFLAFSRLAPVQCVSFGHPNTTGIPAMDYFVSSANFEPPGAAAHYSERLFELNGVGTLAYYYRPRLQAPAKSRAELGLSQSRRIYLCPQSLFKFHPEIDGLLAAVLRQDPEGEIALVEGRVPHRVARLRERFECAFPDLAPRLRFLPGLNEADFLNLVAVSDVMLDTIHFNGMNTSLEAFAMGTPVVTWPRAFQRGRHTAGMYRRMGLEDCVAHDAGEFVAFALRLGLDRDFRATTRERILDRCALLFEEEQVVEEFARFFREAHSRAAAA
ncbi:MAG: tetratricopeptide repeat protein [Betaproteobacteria bacterium]|nr:tetratricopeptide repeat protein [Betaproteobacteria bacterium]